MCSVYSCKLIYRRGSILRDRGALFQIINFIRLTVSREEKAFAKTMRTYAICAIRAKPIYKRQRRSLVREDVN